MIDIRSDLAFILADAPGSVAIVCGSETGKGVLSEVSKDADPEMGRQSLAGVERILVFDPITLPAVKKGAYLTAGGRPFKVMNPVTVREDGSGLAQLGKP
jgi:hypothetical protein